MSKEIPAKTLLIIDGHSWMHRAFHAMQMPMTAPDGQPTNAVFGFFLMLSKTLTLLQPNAVVVAFDEGKPTARIEALAQYKIQRPPTDPNLKAQFPIIKELLAAMRVPVACVPNIEGDDILGTLSRRAEQSGLQVYLATSDRDAYQLISEHTKVISQGRGSDGPRIIGPAEVKERYGVTPDQMIDFLGLKGDTSDNIPGVPGVGEKTAARFLAEYGTLEAVLAAAAEGEIKGKVGENLVKHADCARVSQQVATIVCDVPLDIDLESLSFGSYAAADIHTAFMRYALRSPLSHMAKFAKLDDSIGASDPSVATEASSTVTDTDVAAQGTQTSDQVPQRLDTQVEESEPASLRLEPTKANFSYRGIVIEHAGETLFDSEQILAVAHANGVASSKEEDAPSITQAPSILSALAKLLQDDQKLAAEDLKALFSQLIMSEGGQGPLSNPLLDPAKLNSADDFDLSLAAYLLASYKSDLSLKQLALEYAEIDLDAQTSAGKGAATDGDDPVQRAETKARLVADLAGILEQRLKEEDLLELYRSIELPLIPVLARMEHAGITVDTDKLAELAQYGRERIEALREEIFDLAGYSDFNPDSPKQLAEVLFDRLELPVIKKTRTGRSTNAAVLTELKVHHPIAAKITEYREFTKLQNTYLEAFPKLVAADGRIHTHYNQTVAATGRLSSSNPNLQNIPVRTEMGKRIREAFVPRVGWKLVSADYSQIELRVLAELSQDPGLIEAFKSGEDFHAQTAARIFGLDAIQQGDIDSSLRSRAKVVNFGIIYGQGPHGLSQTLEIPYGEAKDLIDRYYATFPRVKSYLDETIEEAKSKGWVKTYFGRKRHIPELTSSNRSVRAFGERTAMNHPMQGTAADLIKIAMIAVDDCMRSSSLNACMLLQVHDELVFEAPAEEVDQLSELIAGAMTGVAPDFVIPLEVNVTVGDTW